MTTYAPLRQQFTIVNDQGQVVPAEGYRLFTYAAGTSTKVNTYSDFSLTAANSNPIVLNSDGGCTIFLTDGQFYKFVLSPPPQDELHPDDPPDSNIWTQDNIPSTGLISTVVVKTSSYTILAQTDRNKFFSVNATGGNVTLTLPDASDAGNGFVFYGLLKTAGGHNLIFAPVGSDTVGGSSGQTIVSEGEAQGYISDGISNWILFNRVFQGATPAPADATFIVQTPNATLSAEQALSALSTGMMQSTTTTGVVQTRVITGTSNEITITNGDGASGNPTASLPSAITLTGKTITGGTFTTPTVNTPVLTVKDADFIIEDDVDTTKKVAFQASSVSTATTRTKTFQDNNGTIYESGGTDVPVADGGSGKSATVAYGLQTGGTTTTNATQDVTPSVTSGVILRGAGSSALPAWSTATYPGTAGTASTRLKSDGTNIVNTTTTMPDSGTTGKVIIGNGTNYVESTPTFPNASATSLKIIRSDGTNWIASTSTYSDTPSTAGKVLISDGTNWITSTPTFPNASATAGKIIRSNGTNWLEGTSTIPDTFAQGDLIYGSASNVLTALAKDTNSTRYLSNTGSSNNPAWAQVAISTGVSGLGSNVATWLTTPSVANLASALSDDTATSLLTYNTSGLIAQTAANTFTGRTLTGTANKVDISNGDGVSGNPTATLSATLDLSGNTYLKIPAGTAPTVDASGKIAIDTNTDNSNITQGSVEYHDGVQKMFVAAVDTLPSTNGHVLTYDGTNKKYYFTAPTGGASTSARTLVGALGLTIVDTADVALGVNYFKVSDAIATTNPIQEVVGTDTNIGINHQSKGTGTHNLMGTSTVAGSLRMYEKTGNGTNYIGLKAPEATTADCMFVLPDGDGSSGQYIKTDGSKNLSFGTITTNWEKVSAATISSSATVDFTGLTSGYNYTFKLQNVVPATDNTQLWIRTSTDGSSYDSGAGTYSWGYAGQTTISDENDSQSDTKIQMFEALSNVANEGGLNGIVNLYNPANASFTSVNFQASCPGLTNTTSTNYTGSGHRANTSGAVTAIRFLAGSGNLTSGTITLYRQAI